MTALDYVEMKAREEDRGITMEKCRAALGALGIQNSMALNKIGELQRYRAENVAVSSNLVIEKI